MHCLKCQENNHLLIAMDSVCYAQCQKRVSNKTTLEDDYFLFMTYSTYSICRCAPYSLINLIHGSAIVFTFNRFTAILRKIYARKQSSCAQITESDSCRKFSFSLRLFSRICVHILIIRFLLF